MSEFIKKYIGWRNWAVFRYNSVFENLFVLFLIALVQKRSGWVFVTDSLLFIVFSIFATTYGYLINDYADMELDRLHGKPNTFENDSRSKAHMVVFVVLLLAVVSSIFFWNHPYFILLTLIWFGIATFYSLPPIRLKERGTANIVFVVIAQRLLPIVILFAAFDFRNVMFWPGILMYVFLRGLSSDLNHQLEDYSNDVKTGTRTFVVSKGYDRVQRWFTFNLHLEKVMLAIILLQISFIIEWDAKWSQWIWAGTAGIYFIALIWFWLDRSQWSQNPFDPERRNLAQFLHHAYPTVALPLALNLLAIKQSAAFIVLLIFQIGIRRLYSLQILKSNFVVQFLTQKLRG